MRRIISLSLIIAVVFLTTSITLANEVRDSKTVSPSKKVSLYRIPVDPEERAKALNEILGNTLPGEGAFFAFNTLFTPSHPEQSSLRPGILLNQPTPPPYSIKGYCMVRDNTGLRARTGGVRISNNQATQIETIYAGGNRAYLWSIGENERSPKENVADEKYLDVDGKGIRYFLNSVRFKGVLMGPAMEKLIQSTDAKRIGVENIRGTRTLVYGIQPTKQDFMNGYQYLQVWVRVGDFKVIRTNCEASYGREFTEYSRHLTNVSFDDENFLLPNEKIDDMKKEYEKYFEQLKNPQDKNAGSSEAK